MQLPSSSLSALDDATADSARGPQNTQQQQRQQQHLEDCDAVQSSTTTTSHPLHLDPNPNRCR